MPQYVAFLRAINLGAKRTFPKDAIIACAEAAGFTDVQTYLNTGNVRVTSRMRSLPRVATALGTAFAQDRGFEVPTIVFGLAELTEISAQATRLGEAHGPLQRHHVALLSTPLAPEDVARVEAAADQNVAVRVHDRAVHLMWPQATPGHVDPLGAATSRLLGVTTARTAGVLAELVRRWG